MPRTKTETVDDALMRIIGGEDMALIKSFTTAEQAMFYEVVEQVRRRDDMGVTMGDLWRVDYVQQPPTVEQFITDPYWLGRTMHPSADSEGIFPCWRDVLINDFDLDSCVHNVVVTGSLGIGKCLGDEDSVVMFDGTIKLAKDVVSGDLLMGDDSTQRRVISTFSGEDQLYTVYPAKGEEFTATGGHTLCLKTFLSDEVTEITIHDYLALPRAKRKDFRLYRTGVEFSKKDLRIDPYFMGLWLGDGTSNRVEITTMDAEIADYTVRYSAEFGLKVAVVSAGKGAKAKAYRVSKTGTDQDTHWLRVRFNEYGLCFSARRGVVSKGKKFIPNAFLTSDRQQRLALLAGLIDTDGSLCVNGCYEITFVEKRLADDTIFLARSLGYLATSKIKIVENEAYYRIHISGAYDIPVLLVRKKSSPPKAGAMCRYGTRKADVFADPLKTKFAIIPKGVGKYYGFTLDGNHRFLLKDFTVTHNSWILAAIFLYRVTLARLLKDPQTFFGLSKGSSIYYVLLSLTRAVVADTVFSDIQAFMANSEFFTNECHFNPDKKHAAMRVPIGNNIILSAGSKGWHIIGRNTMGVGLDEGNWRLEANPDMKAYALYDEVRTRIKNRFQSLSGFLPAISILSSSAKDESSFTEAVIDDITESGDKNQKVYRFSVWEAKRHKLRLSSEWFKVAYGLKNIEPTVLSGKYTEQGVPLVGDTHEVPPTGANTLLVPWDYHDDFVRKTRTNLQSLGGISTGGSMRLFPSTLDLDIMCDMADEAGIKSPSGDYAELIPLSAEDDKEIWDSLSHRAFVTRRASRVQPIRMPGAPRFAHVDLATSGVAGIAICHLAGTRKVDGVINDEGEPFSEHRSVVEFDFILAITPGTSKPISLEKIQKFFFWLRDYCAYAFELVTYDQFQSAQMLQMMESRNFKTDNLSVDRTKLPYYTFRSAVAEHRVLAYKHHTLLRELEELHDGPDKVDHPADGSKDVADAVCGAVFNALCSKTASAGPSGPPAVSFGTEAQRPPVQPVIAEIARPKAVVFDT